MDIRKIQMSGGSSYIVSLPKKWITRNKIAKNDPVGLIEQDDGTILITPNTSGEQVQKVWNFEVSAITDPTIFLRSLIGAYFAGYTSMRIWAHGRLPPFASEKIRDFTNMAIGQEVVDETETEIILKDLLNPAEMPLENTISRMSVIVQKMHEDAVLALKNRDLDLARNVISRDNDVDRLHWLIGRQTNLILGDINLARKMSVPLDGIMNYFLVSRIIERVGDHASKIAHNAIRLGDYEPPAEIIEMIEEVNRDSLVIFKSSIKSFFDHNLKEANDIINDSLLFEEQCSEINRKALSYEAPIAIPIVAISDSMRRVGDYSADICENVINYVTGKSENYKK